MALSIKAHPFFDLLNDRNISFLWGGLAFSAFGNELNRVAVLWLAIEVAGPNASLLPFAQNALVLAVSLGAGIVVDRLSSRTLMIGSDLLSAVAAALPVVYASIYGVTLPVLIISAMGLSALTAVFQPALWASIPNIARTGERIQAVNGLLDATARLSRLVGPFTAGVLSIALPVIHFLTLNALSFLVSAWSIAAMVRTGGASKPSIVGETDTAMARLLRGVSIIGKRPDARIMLVANTTVLIAWTIGITLGLPFLVAGTHMAGFGLSGLGAVAALAAAYGAGDLVSSVLMAGYQPRRLGRFMFSGYALFGGALVLMPISLWLLPESAWLSATMVAAFVAATGGPMFFIPMMTYLQTQFDGPDLASVIRLRLALMAAAMMIGAGLGPVLFGKFGAVSAIGLAGTLIGSIGVYGSIRWADIESFR